MADLQPQTAVHSRHKLVELRDAESRQVAHKQQELREMFAARIRDKEKESQHKQQAVSPTSWFTHRRRLIYKQANECIDFHAR
jgi:hypothetical protein